ncbi:MAG: hypothetical protein F4X40_07170 [Chloroflexi bacterium]|nr:hypothetical protein [Chloroflexota bacterium]
MKTKLNIDATVMQRVREEAARRETTISALVEAGLRRVLEPDVATADSLPELPRWWERDAGRCSQPFGTRRRAG